MLDINVCAGEWVSKWVYSFSIRSVPVITINVPAARYYATIQPKPNWIVKIYVNKFHHVNLSILTHTHFTKVFRCVRSHSSTVVLLLMHTHIYLYCNRIPPSDFSLFFFFYFVRWIVHSVSLLDVGCHYFFFFSSTLCYRWQSLVPSFIFIYICMEFAFGMRRMGQTLDTWTCFKVLSWMIFIVVIGITQYTPLYV